MYWIISKERGSITVEAAILVPLIISSIVAVIFIGLLYYQRALLQSAADRTVQAGAASWCNISSDMATGKTEIGKLGDAGLYWRLFESGKNEKVNRIKNYSEQLLKKRCILKPSDSDVFVEIKDFIVYKKLVVTVENSYPVPGGSLTGLFGLKGCVKIKVTSYANINDPSEFIRNTDFILDIEKELENKYEGLKNIADKTREIFGSIKSNIEKLTNK